MKKSILLLSSIFLINSLASCSSSNVVNITFVNEDSETYTVSLAKGDSVANALDGKVEVLEEFAYSSSKEFDNWYLSSSDASSLDVGEANSNLFSIYEEVESSLTVYAGYGQNIDYIEDFKLYDYLGSAIDDSSPFPRFIASEVAGDTFNDNGIYYLNTSINRFNEYKRQLIEDDGFSLLEENKYLSPNEKYIISLEYEESKERVHMLTTFNDVDNEFPTNFFASSFLGMDYSMYINESSFSLSENAKDLKNKYFTYFGDYSSYSNVKIVGYTPKSDDSSSIVSLASYLSSNGFTLASSTSYIYVDNFATSYLFLAQSNSTLLNSFGKLGLKEGMNLLISVPIATSSLDEDSLSSYYKSTTGGTFSNELYPSFLADKYGTIARYTINSSKKQYGVGYYAIGFSVDYFNYYIKSLTDLGYTYSYTSSGDYRYVFTFTSKDQEYGLKVTYYLGSHYTDLLNNVALIIYYHNDSVYDLLAKWLNNQNVGGGELTGIPTFEAKSYTSGNLTSSGNSVPYTYYISGTSVEESEYTSYLVKLEDSGFSKDSQLSNEEYTVYNYQDGYYRILVYFEDSTLTIQLYYLGSKEFSKFDDIVNYLTPRLGDSLTIPGVNEVITSSESLIDTSIDVMQYYDGTYHRGVIYLYSDSSDKQNSIVSILEEAVTNEDSGFSYIGANSSGIKFYKNSSGLYYYIYTGNSTSNDVTSYYTVVGLYRS